MSITKQEAKELIADALAQFAATHPLPAVMTVADVADKLKMSPRTVRRWFKVTNGTVRYADVLEHLAK